MKLALCQTDIIWEEKLKNIKKAEAFIKKAAENKAELAVFPEMSFTGFTVNIKKCGESFDSSETVEKIIPMAKKYNIAIGFGIIVREGEKNYNRFVIIDKNGNMICRYDKIHPFSYSEEGKFFTGGQKLSAVKIGDTCLSPYVCYDLRFPEIFTAASYKSSLLIIAANWPASRIEQWSALLKARAIENQCYVAGVNRTGEGGSIIYNGHSVFYDPQGNILSEAGEAEGIIYGEVFPQEVEAYRNKFRMKCDRKEELYTELFKNIKK